MPPVSGKQNFTGHIGSLSPQQADTLEKFREEIKGEDFYDAERHDDACLLRFLRARKFDLAKTKKMFVDCEIWRKEFGVDELVKTFKYTEREEVMKYYARYYHKIDKEGRPIYIEEIDNFDIKGLYSVTTIERQLQNLVVEYEKLAGVRVHSCSAKAGKLIETSCTIINLKGVSVRSFSGVYNFIKQASNIGQNYYPERMGKFYIVNAPSLFSTVWNLVKPMLDEVTAAKIVILGNKYQKTLLENIDPENLPEKLGGRCKCEGGCEYSDAGPWNDPEFTNGYMSDKVITQEA